MRWYKNYDARLILIKECGTLKCISYDSENSLIHLPLKNVINQQILQVNALSLVLGSHVTYPPPLPTKSRCPQRENKYNGHRSTQKLNCCAAQSCCHGSPCNLSLINTVLHSGEGHCCSGQCSMFWSMAPSMIQQYHTSKYLYYLQDTYSLSGILLTLCSAATN